MNEAKDKVEWCIQKKKGISIGIPNDILCSAYLNKARNSLKAMDLNLNANILDWAVETAYYARYQAVYALLQKCGIKSEIHDCSIAVCKFIFKEYFSEEFFEELEKAKEQRINLIYYTDRLVPRSEIEENIRKAPLFILEIEKFLERTKPNQIKEWRALLKSLL
ncbi:HEPN domain-containing protein [Candidatus Woesearchaeota archaeon]|nr:HEPN domain-containing protein [Candidatus Woesearchaeota archaeon]